MSLERPSRKPVKLKKTIAMLDCLKQFVSSDKENVQKLHDQVVVAMRQRNPALEAELMQEVDETPQAGRMDPVQKCDQEIQVSMEALNNSMETNTVSTTQQNGAASQTVISNGSHFSPKKASTNSTIVGSFKRRSKFDPSFVIKVEDSGSDDSNHSEETKKTEHLVHKMMAPCFAPLNPASAKSFLHYVVIENLPIRSSADEVVNELFIGLLGISRDDVTGITVHNEKTESIAQIYFKDLKHVQKILVFSGKLVFKGRVITSKIGTS